MKTRNVVLGLSALVFAVGTAVASTFALQSAFIKVKFSATAPNFSCVNSGVTCEETGPVRCQVHIPELNTDVAAYRAGCTQPLNQSSAAPIANDQIAQTIVAVQN